MARFLTTDDFINKFEVTTGLYQNDKIQSYLDRYEDEYLVKMLGVELYDLFIADLDVNNEPQDIKFTNLFDPFNYQEGFSLLISRGIKDMLLGFLYFEYMKDLATQTTSVGVVKPEEQNSKVVSAHTPIYLKYNESIKTYNAIQEYILLNMTTYPEFRGVRKLYAYWL
jgi:hypothetical protein